MQRALGVLCFVLGHDVVEWVPFLRRSHREEVGVCRRCTRVTGR